MSETFVYIENLRIHACHGVLPQERTVGNDYVVNVRVGYPWQRAMETDDVTDTVDYAALAGIVERVMMTPSALLEHVAGRMLREIQDAFPKVTSLTIDIKKVAPPISQETDGCGVTLRVKLKS